MKKLTCTILLSALALQYSRAADATNATAATTPAPPAGTEPTPAPAAIEVKNKSSFAMQENSRNPFWPIGWKPAAKQALNSSTEAGAVPDLLPGAFLVSSIVLDPNAPFAIINGKPMMQGQVFGLQMGTQTYQITVKSIEDGQVVLLRGRDQEIVVPLRRR